MRRSNFALRLQPSLLNEARKAAEAEGVALNQLINLALAEKVSALRTVEYFRERAARAKPAEFFRILARTGKDHPPVPGDELPPGWEQKSAGHRPGRKSIRQARSKRRTRNGARRSEK